MKLPHRIHGQPYGDDGLQNWARNTINNARDAARYLCHPLNRPEPSDGSETFRPRKAPVNQLLTMPPDKLGDTKGIVASLWREAYGRARVPYLPEIDPTIFSYHFTAVVLEWCSDRVSNGPKQPGNVES